MANESFEIVLEEFEESELLSVPVNKRPNLKMSVLYRKNGEKYKAIEGIYLSDVRMLMRIIKLKGNAQVKDKEQFESLKFREKGAIFSPSFLSKGGLMVLLGDCIQIELSYDLIVPSLEKVRDELLKLIQQTK